VNLSIEIQLPEAPDQRAEVLDFLSSRQALRLELPAESEDQESLLQFLTAHGAKVTYASEGVTGEHKDRPSFSERWKGAFVAAEKKGDPRYDRLAEKYLT